MPTAALNGTSIHYEVDGDGPPLVVLHGGLGVDHVIYRRTLAPMAADFRLVFPDHRANGRSAGDPATLTIEQLADDVVALADHLGLGRFTVLGHSYGGFVAQEVALRHPTRLDRLVLVSTTPGQLGSGEEPGPEQGPPPPPEVIAVMSTVPTSDAQLEEGMAELSRHYFHRPEALDLPSLHEGTTYRFAAMLRGFEVLAGWSSVDRLHLVDVPTLVLAGRHDVFTSFPQAHRIAARIPAAEVVVFEESGHYPWIEEPARFFPLLTAWLTSR